MDHRLQGGLHRLGLLSEVHLQGGRCVGLGKLCRRQAPELHRVQAWRVSVIHDHIVGLKCQNSSCYGGKHHDQGARDDQPNVGIFPPRSIVLSAKGAGHDGFYKESGAKISVEQ
jgi:hypothetical protein